MTAGARATAMLTSLLFATELVSPPCGTACHQTQAEHASAEAGDASSEHACHEAPVQEDVAQIAGIPAACTHQHDRADSPRTSGSSDRDHQTALMPAFVLLASYETVVRADGVLSPQPRESISIASLSVLLRI
jgi:hypothetical protein